MRTIDAKEITEAVERLFVTANYILPDDIRRAEEEAGEKELSPRTRKIYGAMLENADLAASYSAPICQDTGMCVVFAEIGQDVHIIGDFKDAVDKGTALAWENGYLRASVVEDPLRRVNTGDNAPAVVHINLVPGENIRLRVMPKGFGSENMSAVRMLNPSAAPDDVARAITDIARDAGSNPCPPMVLGVGLGGTFDSAARASKEALFREIGSQNPDPFYNELEKKTLALVNKLDIGAQGFGGAVTALAVHIIPMPTHIAGLPLAVNVGCHVTRHAEAII